MDSMDIPEEQPKMCVIAWQGFSLLGGLAVVLRVQVWGTNPSMASAAAPGLHTNP